MNGYKLNRKVSSALFFASLFGSLGHQFKGGRAATFWRGLVRCGSGKGHWGEREREVSDHMLVVLGISVNRVSAHTFFLDHLLQ